jgi:hypothetical protein
MLCHAYRVLQFHWFNFDYYVYNIIGIINTILFLLTVFIYSELVCVSNFFSGEDFEWLAPYSPVSEISTRETLTRHHACHVVTQDINGLYILYHLNLMHIKAVFSLIL